MSVFHQISAGFFGRLLDPAAVLGPLGGLVAISAVSGILLLFAFRFTSRPKAIRSARRRVRRPGTLPSMASSRFSVASIGSSASASRPADRRSVSALETARPAPDASCSTALHEKPETVRSPATAFALRTADIAVSSDSGAPVMRISRAAGNPPLAAPATSAGRKLLHQWASLLHVVRRPRVAAISRDPDGG